MFNATTETVVPGNIVRYDVTANGAKLAFEDVLKLWTCDANFRMFYSQLLANSSFNAFRWETPVLTKRTAALPFEFVLINSPTFRLRAADPESFSEYFENDNSDSGILQFNNLGGDSTMVVPSPRDSHSVYGHFADFIRGAPKTQVEAMWEAIGRLALSRLTAEPFWISTAGGGVAWLHVRFDSRPKYYGYKPYRQNV